MKILDVQQGTGPWLAARRHHNTASEANAMMGTSVYLSRSELIHRKATDIEPDYDQGTLARFRRGHEAEAQARPILEGSLGQDLYPVTAIDDDGWLLASLDGLTMDEETIFEHKLWNEEFAAQVKAGIIPDTHVWQLEQQLYVTGAKRVIFVVSDGTQNNWEQCEYVSQPSKRAALIAGWEQFSKDVAAYVPAEVIPAAVATPIRDLPALDIQIIGNVVASNLDAWKGVVISRIDGINTDLKTDQDFADAAETVKFLDDGEKRIDLVKQQAQAQASSIDEAFRAMDEIKATMRAKRLELDKLVTARKEAIKTEQVMRGRNEFAEYVTGLNARIGKSYMPAISVDFATAIKGKRTVSSLTDAVDTLLANKKAEADQIAARIEANIKTLHDLAADHAFLFSDVSGLVLKDIDAVEAIVKSRIAEHKAAEEKRLEAEREKIRIEEEAKVRREVEQKAQMAEHERLVAERAAQRITDEERKAAANNTGSIASNPVSVPDSRIDAIVPQLVPSITPIDTGATIKLGEISARLGFTVTAEFLFGLGFTATAEKNAKLYREADFRSICSAIVRHIEAVAIYQVKREDLAA